MKFKGKWDIRKWEDLTGSADLSSRRRLPKKTRVPYEFRRGKKSKFFKKTQIAVEEEIPIVKLDEKYSFIRVNKKEYGESLYKQISQSVHEHPRTFSADELSSFSASIFAKFELLPPVIMFMAEDEAEGVMTGSYFITSSVTNTTAYSGIANSSGYIDWQFNNDSVFNTGASWSFANTGSVNQRTAAPASGDGINGTELHQTDYTSSFTIRMFSSGSRTGSYIASRYVLDGTEFYNDDNFSDRPFFVSPTGSTHLIDYGNFENYNYYVPFANNTGSHVSYSSAGFNSTFITANIFGDGNEENFATGSDNPNSALYAAKRELISFPSNTVVESGSFFFCPSFETLVGATIPGQAGFQPITQVLIYWASGSGGLIGEHGLSGSISPSTILPDSDSIAGATSGSHIFLNSDLTMPASGGYYHTETPLNYPAVFDTETFGPDADGSLRGGLPVSGTIHVAGDGMRGTSIPGQHYFKNPFRSAHEETSSIINAAPRWNGISFSRATVNLGADRTGFVSPGDEYTSSAGGI